MSEKLTLYGYRTTFIVMESTQVLQEFGLTQNEAAVYLALLQLGPSPVAAIAKRAGLKRPTTYLILDDLIQKNLVAIVPQEKRRLFIALPPDRLREQLQRKIEMVEKALPELVALYRTQTKKPAIQFFESREGILNVYRDISNAPMKEMLGFFSPAVIPKEFDEVYEPFIHLYKNRHIKGREIVSAKNPKHFYLEKLKNLPNYEVRISPAPHRFFNDTFIYADKISIISFKKRFALTIENEEVAGSFRSLFELAWQSVETI